MKRIVIHRPGSYDQLQIEEVADLTPGSGEVVVETEAIGINYADCVIRMGLYQSALEFVGWPITPGFETAGVVAAVGDGVEDLEVGQPVMAISLFGGYATQVRVPRHQVFDMIDDWSARQCAGFPAVHATAWYALRELCKLRPGMRVLVHSAAGGVGSALVQICRIFDLMVVGVVGATHKVETAESLGCDHVIDKSREDLWARAEQYSPDGYDIVLDANGVATLKQSYEHLASAGRLVIYGFHTMMPKSSGADDGGRRRGAFARVGDTLRLPGSGRPNFAKLARDYLRTPRFDPLRMTNDNKSVLAFNLSYLFDRTDIMEEGMNELLGWCADGGLRPPTVTTYPMSDVGRAHADIESGQTVGKLVLVP